MFTLRKSALLIVVGLLLLSVGVAAAKPKNPPSHGRGGGAPISWTPAKLTMTLDASGAGIGTATFVSSVALNNVVVNVPVALGRILQVSPATFAHVEAGVSQTVTFSIAAGATTHNQGGVVQLLADGRMAPKPLPVLVRLPRAGGDGEGDD